MEKCTKAKVLEIPGTRFHLSSLSGVMHTSLDSPSNGMWHHTWSIAHQKLRQALVSRVFIADWCYGHVWLPTRLTLVSSPSPGRADTMWTEGPSVKHLAGSRSPGKEKHSYQTGYSTSLEVRSYLTRAGQQSSLPLEGTRFRQPTLAKLTLYCIRLYTAFFMPWEIGFVFCFSRKAILKNTEVFFIHKLSFLCVQPWVTFC